MVAPEGIGEWPGGSAMRLLAIGGDGKIADRTARVGASGKEPNNRAQRTDVATTFRAACCRYRCDGATRGARRTRESETVRLSVFGNSGGFPPQVFSTLHRGAQLAAPRDHLGRHREGSGLERADERARQVLFRSRPPSTRETWSRKAVRTGPDLARCGNAPPGAELGPVWQRAFWGELLP